MRFGLIAVIAVTLLLSGLDLVASDANAEGAIAIGIARGGVVQGYAIGWSNDLPSKSAAQKAALDGCRTSPNSNKPAQQNCKLVGTIVNQCVASALDPKNGTPGAGWAVAATQADADDAALAKCRSTAGAARRDFCKVMDRRCDGSAK